MATLKVGGEVDTICNRCKLTLAHTILAMVGQKIARVRCNTCGGDHAFHAPEGSSAPRAPRSPREPRATKVIIGFDERVHAKGLASARKYSPKEIFAVDELIEHPTFGYGIVEEVRGDKVDVAFKADRKTLIHARGTPAPASESPPG